MNYLTQALAWLADPAHRSGPDGIWTRLIEHLYYTVLAVAIAALIAIPIGWLIGHSGRGRGFVVALTGAARALPILGVVTIVALWVGIGLIGPITALVILAIPSLLAGAYSGIDAIDRRTIDAAKAMGFSPLQVLTRVEIPLGLPLLLGGLRSATLQVVATATLVAWVGGGGLGRMLFLGLKTQDYPQMLAASILVVALAIVLELSLDGVQRVATRSFPNRIKEDK